MRRCLLLTALMLLAAVPAASAATTWVVRGAGFGHGIGMSQYGAYGFAQKGSSHEQILAHYYRGTELGRASNRPVRVLLQASDPFVRFRGANRAAGGRTLDPGTTYVVRPAGGTRLALFAGSRRVTTFTGAFRVFRRNRPVQLLGGAINGVSSGSYRGSMVLHPGGAGGVTAVNSLPVDDYVKGVVAGEMPSSWHIEALRAQSVAARTYGLATSKTDGGVFDHYPDTRSQVYTGLRGETARTNQAVQDTSRQIVTYQGDIATTYFFSTSGGRTEDVQNSFIGATPEPYLRSVPDPFDRISPKHRWSFRFSPSSLGAKLGSPGALRGVRVIKRGSSPRIVSARVTGSRGSTTISGPTIRARLGLFDTWAYFTRVSSSQARSRQAGAARAAFPTLAGSIRPAPRSGQALVQRREGRGWKRVGSVELGRGGSFRTTVAADGRYRVRSGDIVGPTVRVRD
jgi:stage II sporulation protein D